jgi:hypothetical protein
VGRNQAEGDQEQEICGERIVLVAIEVIISFLAAIKERKHSKR